MKMLKKFVSFSEKENIRYAFIGGLWGVGIKFTKNWKGFRSNEHFG